MSRAGKVETTMQFEPPANERGAALLTVLLLVAVMSVIAATALDRLNLATKLAGNGSQMAQARAYSYAAEDITATRIEDLVTRDAAQLTNAGGWLGSDFPVPVDDGTALVRLDDANNCFNLNSLVVESDQGHAANPLAIVQFRKLLQLLDIDENASFAIAESAADWIDSDGVASPNGAEDSYYRGLNPAYLPANRLMADKSELLSVRGIDASIYSRVSDYICALPVAAPTKLNANTLQTERAALLAMLFEDGLSVQKAKAYLANRPTDGYGSAVRFWNAPMLASLNVSPAVKAQVGLKSEWFFMTSQISVGEISLQSRALLSAEQGSVQVTRRQWNAAG